MPDRRNWYYSKDKQRQGPMSETVMAALIAGGVVTPDTYVWTKSAGAWVRMGDTDLARYLSAQEAPPGDMDAVPPGDVDVDAVPPAPDEEGVPQPTDEPQGEEPAPKPARKRAAQQRISKKPPAADGEDALPAEHPEEEPASKPAKKRAPRKPRVPKALPLDESSSSPMEVVESPPVDEPDAPPLLDDNPPNAAQAADEEVPPLDGEEDAPPEVPSPEPRDEPPTLDEPETPPSMDEDTPPLNEIEDDPSEPAQAADDEVPSLDSEEGPSPEPRDETPVLDEPEVPPSLDEDTPPLDEIEDALPNAAQGSDDDIPPVEGVEETPSLDVDMPLLNDAGDDQPQPAQDMDDAFPSLGSIEESYAAAPSPEPPAPQPAQSGVGAESPPKVPPKEKKGWKFALRKRAAIFAALLIVGMSALAFAVYRFGFSRAAAPGEDGTARTTAASGDLVAVPPPDGTMPAGMGAPEPLGVTDDGGAEDAAAPPSRRDLPRIPRDFELARAYVTEENTSIRKTPSMAGVIAYRLRGKEAIFIVARSMIADGSDGSGWFEIICFAEPLGYDHYLREPLYVSSRSVKTVPLEREDRDELAWFRKGRPPLFNTGDEFPDAFEVESFYDVFELTEPVAVRIYPDRNAESVTLRRGTRIYNLLPPSGHFPGEHADVDNERWRPVVGGDKKVLGWIGPEDVYPGTPSG